MQETMEDAAAHLKRELLRAVEALVDEEDEDDCSLEATDHLIRNLSSLKILKLKNSNQEFEMENENFLVLRDEIERAPPQFKCPISGLLMRDPVVLASGQTFDRPCIQKWLREGHQKCPQTDQLLPHTLLISNHSIKKMIFEWCRTNQLEMPSTILDDDNEQCKLSANQEHLITLLEKLSSSPLSDTKQAVEELRMLTERFPSFRALFGDVPDAILWLFNPLVLQSANLDEGLREDLVAIVLNISIHEKNKKKMVENVPSAVSFLIESLRNEKIETRSYAVAALTALSDLHSNKQIIGKSGVFKPLIDLVEEGHPFVLHDTVSTLVNLLSLVENRDRAISEGIVSIVMAKIIDHILVDEMLEILALLSSHQRAMEEMEAYGMIFLLFNILREKTSERNKENCVAILYNHCFNDRSKLRQIGEMEDAYETLCQVARSGNARAKRKAKGILERLNRFAFVSVSHSA